MPCLYLATIIFAAYFWHWADGRVSNSLMINGQQMMPAGAFHDWDPNGANTFEDKHNFNVPGMAYPIQHQLKYEQNQGQYRQEHKLDIPGMPGMAPHIQTQHNLNINGDPSMEMPHVQNEHKLNFGPEMGGGFQSEHNMNIGGDGGPGMPPHIQTQHNFNIGGTGMPNIQQMHNFNIGGPYGGFQHQSNVNIFHPPMPPMPPPAEPAPQPAEPSAEPSAPPLPEDDGIVPWDKPTLLHEMANTYTQTCKKSDVLVMAPETRMQMIVASKKQPIPLDQFDWVVDVDKVCDFLNLVPEIMYKRVDCFRINIPKEFEKALKMHGIPLDSRVHGDLYGRYLACELMRKFDAEELKESRRLANDEYKNGIIDVILDEHKSARVLPPTGTWTINLHSSHNAAYFFWEFATYLNHYHMRHFVQKEGDVCHILHIDQDFYNYYVKMTTGIDPNFDQAIQQLKGIMAVIPLDLSPNRLGDENCTYDLFLLRPMLELFLALIHSMMDEHHGWFKKFGNYAHGHFCPQRKPNCGYTALLHKVNGYRGIAQANVEALKAWFAARGHGKIQDDYAEFEARVAGKFSVHIPDPPAPKKFKYKYSVQTGDGTYIKNKVKHDPVSNVTRMKSKYVSNHYDHYGGSNVVKSKSEIHHGPSVAPHYGPPFGGHPTHFNAQHNIDMGHGHFSSSHNINAIMGGPHHGGGAGGLGGGGQPPMMGGTGTGGLGGPPMGGGMMNTNIRMKTTIRQNGIGGPAKKVRFDTGHPQIQYPPSMGEMHPPMDIQHHSFTDPATGANVHCMFGGDPQLRAQHIVIEIGGDPNC